MTREQLDAIRARVDELNATNGHEPAAWEENRLSMANTNALLAEVERLRAELDTVGEVLAATSLKCDYAFRRGVAAMREAAASVIEAKVSNPYINRRMAEEVRALPDPEDTE